MRDNELIRLFIPIIRSGLQDAGFTDVQIAASYQPTQQSINTASTVFFHKIGDHRYGFVYRNDEWDSENERMVHTEMQQYETTFQVDALVISKPALPSYTASDLVNEVAAILQSNTAIKELIEHDVGILRITDIRNPYFTDDRDRFEASPSFDFVLTHKQTRISTEPVIESYEFDMYRI